MNGTELTLRPALPQDAPDLAEIFLAARRTSLPYLRVVHSDDDVRSWYARTLIPAGHVIVAERSWSGARTADSGSDGDREGGSRRDVGGDVDAGLDVSSARRVLGFADAAPGWLNHLYVDPTAQGHGVGTALFRRATQIRPAGFDLWVFQRNTGALRFYARHGCRELRRTDGMDNEESEPDVLLRWAPEPT